MKHSLLKTARDMKKVFKQLAATLMSIALVSTSGYSQAMKRASKDDPSEQPASKVVKKEPKEDRALARLDLSMNDVGAEGLSFMQIINLIQDLVDASARGSAGVQESLENTKECLSKITDDAEYVSTLAEICGQVKELPQEIVQQISGALGTRLRTAMASWKLTEENYSSFIDLAALFPEVAIKTRVEYLKDIVEAAIEKGDLTKLIIALTELSLLPENLSLMLLELSNRHADKFMAELKEGRGLYAFMQLISRYPGRLKQLLKHGSAAVLAKILELNSSEGREEEAEEEAKKEMEEKKIEEKKLEKLLSGFADNNPVGFVELMAMDPHSSLIVGTAAKHPGLVIRCSDKIKTSLAEHDLEAFVMLVGELVWGDFWDDNSELDHGMNFLARRDPETFIRILVDADWSVWDRYFNHKCDIHCMPSEGISIAKLEWAGRHPELLIRYSDEIKTESLAERNPRAFVDLLSEAQNSSDYDGQILDDEQLSKGLEFLAVHNPGVFVELLSQFLCSEVSDTCLSVVIAAARRHPELVIRCSEEVKTESLAEGYRWAFVDLLKEHSDVLDEEQLQGGIEFLVTHNPEAFIELLSFPPELSSLAIETAKKHPQDYEQVRKKLELLAAHTPEMFIALLSGWGSLHVQLPPVVAEVARRYPRLLIGYSSGSEVKSLLQRDLVKFVNLVKGFDILDEEQLSVGLELLAIDDPATFIVFLAAWGSANSSWSLLHGTSSMSSISRGEEIPDSAVVAGWRGSDDWSPVICEVARNHPELLIRTKEGGVRSLAESVPEAFVSLMKKTDILNDEQLQAGLEFLAKHNRIAFLVALRYWLSSSIERLPIACGVALKCMMDHGRLNDSDLQWCYRNSGLSDNDVSQQVYAYGAEPLATHAPRVFVELLSNWSSFPDKLLPVVIEVAKQHPELVIRCSEEVKTESLAERDHKAFVRLLKKHSDVLDEEQLRMGLEFLAIHNFEVFRNVLFDIPSKRLPVAIEIAKKHHPELVSMAEERKASHAQLVETAKRSTEDNEDLFGDDSTSESSTDW